MDGLHLNCLFDIDIAAAFVIDLNVYYYHDLFFFISSGHAIVLKRS
jgi:hypothetical protein